MNYGSLYALLSSAGFKINVLTVRLLQEKGVDKLDTYRIYRFALIPSVIWSLIFIRSADLKHIFHTPELLIIFGVIVVFWNLQAYLRIHTTNGTNSMVLLTTIYTMLALPLSLALGTFFNHDAPNIFSLSAILVLLVALFIKPAPHLKNLRPSLSKPLPMLVLLVFFTACCDNILQGMAREALKQLRPVVFLGAFSVPTLSVCWLLSKRYTPRQAQETETAAMKQRQWLAISLMPMTWFAASIPEAFSLAAIPIYVYMSIGVLTFLMDTISDVLHKRIKLGFQTISFIIAVLLGIILSIRSV